MSHTVVGVLLILLLVWPDHASRDEAPEQPLRVPSEWEEANQREFEVQMAKLEDIIPKLAEGDPDKETARRLLTKLRMKTATSEEKAVIYRLSEKAQIEGAKQLLQRMPGKIRRSLFTGSESRLQDAINDPDKFFLDLLKHIQQTEGMSTTPNLVHWMKYEVIKAVQKEDSSRVSLRNPTIAIVDQVFEEILASEVKVEVQAEFTVAKELWDRTILPYLNLNEEDWGEPKDQLDSRNQLRSIFSQNEPKALTEDQKKWLDQAEFNAQKEVWDTRILPYLLDSDELGSSDVYFLTISNLRDLFDGPPKKLTEEQKLELDNCEVNAAKYLLSTKLTNTKGAQDLKERITSKLKAEDRKSLEKMEVEAALDKFLKDDIKHLQRKSKMSEEDQHQLTRGYTEAAIEYLTSLDQTKSIDELQLRQWSMWTDKQIKGISNVMHLAWTEAANARFWLRHELRDFDGAEELGNEISNTDHLSNSQRQRLENLHRLLTVKQLEKTIEEERAEQQGAEAKQNKRDQKEVHDAVKLLLDLPSQVPGARDLLNAIEHASKLTDDQKQRLKAVKTHTRNSASKVHWTTLLHIALLRLAAQ